MFKKIISFFALASIFSLAGLVLAGSYYTSLPSKSGIKSLASQSVAVSQINLENNYQKYAAAAISSLKKKKIAGKDSLSAVKEAKKSLLALRVPAKYTKLHLDLIISLGLMEEGLTTNKAKLALGEKQLQDLTGKYSWLLAKE